MKKKLLTITGLSLAVVSAVFFFQPQKNIGLSGNTICSGGGLGFIGSIFGNLICSSSSTTPPPPVPPPTPPPLGWTPMDIPNLELWVQSAYSQHIYQEPDSVSTTLTMATTSGQRVGTIFDSSPRAHEIASNASTRRPTLYVSATSSVPSFFSFSTSTAGGDAPTNLQVRNSQNAFRETYTGASTTIMAKVQFTTNSTSAFTFLLDSGGSASNQTGLSVIRTTGNRIQVLVSKGVSGAPVFNYTSVAPILSSNGVTPVVIRFSTTTNNIQIGNNALETFSRSNPPTSTPSASAQNDLFIGSGIGGTTNNANMNLQDLVIVSDYLSTSTIDMWRSFTPSSTPTTSLLVATSTSQGDFNFLNQWFRFNVTSSLWADSARATQATSSVWLIDHFLNGSLNKLNRSASVPSATGTPVFSGTATGTIFDGTDDYMTLTARSARGAPKTVFIAARNQDTTNGSHVLSGTQYLPITGALYSGNLTSSCLAPYFTIHPSTGATIDTCLVNTNRGIVEFVRDGSTFTQLHNGTNSSSGTSALEFSWLYFGREQIAGWYMDGEICEIREYDAVLSASQRATVRNQIASNCNITLP